MKIFFGIIYLFTLLSSVVAEEDKGIPSILLQSVVANNLDGVNEAIRKGENINLVNLDGMTAARIAAQLSNGPILHTLIKERIDLNIPDKNGITALMVAAEQVSCCEFWK
jgi:ankyrin repeat protein